MASTQLVFSTHVHSPLELELRNLITNLYTAGKILGIQVCAYKDGKVIIDTAAGFLGENDPVPRPVQPDSLFSVFSASKGITAGLMHSLLDKRQIQLDDNIASIWPEFASSNKANIKVHHVLNHTSGLHSALSDIRKDNSLSICDWNNCLRLIAQSSPETEPGRKQIYHYISFGWLCGGIIEHATGKKFQDVLKEAITRPLQIENEMYIGIPRGVEHRLASLTVDNNVIQEMSSLNNRPDLPPDFQPKQIAQISANAPDFYNNMSIRRAIIPAGNAHCSARALARYYASLADTEIHDQFMGLGKYEQFALPGGIFGLGFMRTISSDGSGSSFGHFGLSGSTGFCDVNHGFAIAITLNKMSFNDVTPVIVEFVCSKFNISFPEIQTRFRV